MAEKDAALTPAYQSLRNGEHQMQEKMSASDIVALYDSILLGMYDYIAKHKRCASFIASTNLWDGVALYHALARAGVFEDLLTFNRFSLTVERGLWQGSLSFEADAALADAEMMLARLGVMPSNDSALVENRDQTIDHE